MTAVFPSLPGLTFPVKRTEIWQSRVQLSISGKEVRIADWSYPRHQWEQTYDVLRGAPAIAEQQALMGFFNLCQGPLAAFLYQDADDGATVGQSLGIGDAATTTFQLVRAMGGFVEPILAPNVVTAVRLNGVPLASNAYSVDPETGRLAFVSPPGAGISITADFSYYFRCRFLEDTMDFEKFMSQLWQAKSVRFISLK
ncbi:MAG TPA: DUF2460 domain-containing protein [Stellaceae bacterium]|nr:DUF2460 domain-containing protein [Stellaceae bacterium]